MNYRVVFNKQPYALHQDFPNYFELLDQIKANISGVPELYSITYVGNGNAKMNINNQEDVEAVFYSGDTYATLQIEDLNDDIFNMTLEEKNEGQQMDVEGEEKQKQGMEMEEEDGEQARGDEPDYSNLMVEGTQAPYTNFKTEEQTLIQNATCIQSLFGCSYEQGVEFVNQNPGLNQQQLIELALQLKNNQNP